MVKDNLVSINRIVEQDVLIYPNPTSGQFILSFGLSPIKTAIIEVCDLQGGHLLSKIFHNTISATIDLTGFSKGIYLAKVRIDGTFYYQKICVK